MPFDFPSSPTPGSIYSPAGGPSYTWDGQKWAMTGSPITYYPPFTAQTNNLVVNGAFQYSQELAANTWYSGGYPADNWLINNTQGTKAQWMLLAGPSYPGFIRYSCVTTFAPAATDNCAIWTKLEGSNLFELGWGQTWAIPAVLSFEARFAAGSVNGPFSAWIRSSNADRSIVFPFTITAGIGNWQKFSFAVPAITSGTFPTTNGIGIDMGWSACCGTNNQTATAGAWVSAVALAHSSIANLYTAVSNAIDIRNVALYPDPNGTGVAPLFQQPDPTVELQRCRRYYQLIQAYSLFENCNAAVAFMNDMMLVPTMRAAPTVTYNSPAYTNASGATVNIVRDSHVMPRAVATAAGNASFQADMVLNARLP